MPIDVTTIGVEYRTDGLEKGTRSLRANEQQAYRTADAADKLGGRTQHLGRQFAALESSVSIARTALGGIGAGLFVRSMIQMADAVTLMDARLRLAVKGSADFAQAQRDIESIARRTNAGLAETTTLYTKLSDPVRALGGGIREVSGITEAFALSLKVSGANTAEAAAATLQFAQAMASGAFRGDEFNSVAEANPRLMKALAAGIGVGVGSLRQMAADGKLTADVIGNALVGQLQTLRSESEQIPLTIGAAMQSVGNSTLKLVGDFDKLTGGSGNFADMIVRYVTPALKALYSAAVGVQQAFNTLGIGIGGTLAAIAAVLRGEFGQAREIMSEMMSDVSSNWEKAGASINATWQDFSSGAGYTAEEMTKLNATITGNDKAAKAAANAARKLANEYAALVSKISGKSSGTDSDFLKNLKLLADGGKKAGLSLAEIVKLQEAYIAQQPYMVEQAKAREKAEEDAKKAVDELFESRNALFDQAKANQKKADDMLAQLRFEAQLIGMTNEERTVAIALRQLEATGVDTTTQAYQRLRAEIEQQVRGNMQAEAGIEAAKKVQKEWEETNRQIGESFVDNLMRGGKSVSEYLKDLFRTLVLRPILAPIGSAVAGVAGSALGMPAAAQGVGGSLVGSAAGSAAGSWLGSTMAGGSFLSGVSGASAALAGGSTFGVTGAIGSIPAAIGTGGTGLAGAAGSMGAGVSGALGAVPVAGWAALAALAIASLAKGGETRSGGAYSDTSFLQGPSGGEINAEATRTAIGSTMQGINEMLRALGSTATLANLQSGFESSKHGKGFAYAGGQLSTGAVFGQGVGGLGWQNRRGSMTPEEAATAFGEELKQATLQALQEAGVPGILGDYLRSLGDIDALSGGALDAALGRIQQALSEKQALEEQMLTLQSTDLENLTRARERERKALDESNWALYDQVTALMDQKAAAEAAARAAEEAAARQREIDQERYGLETTLLQLQGDTVGLRRRELEALDPSNRALQEYIWTLQDAAVEADKAQAATEKAMQAQQQYRDGLLADVNRTKGELLAGYEREAGALRQTIQAHRQYANDLREFRTSLFLGGDSPLRLNDRTDLAQRQFDVTIAKAQAGDLDAIAQLQGDGTAYLAALKNSALTKFDYSLGVARVAAGLTITAAKSDATATAAQSQLDVMTSQLTALGVLTDVTQQGFAALLANYVGAKNNAAAAGAVQLDQSLTNGVTLGDGTFLSPDFLSSTMGEFQQMNAIQGLYMDTFGRAADREGLEYHMAQLDRGVTYDQLAAQFAQARLDGSHADGLDYVPFDGYRAELHRGERVLSMSDNAALTSAIERMAVQIEQQGRQIDALVTHSYQSRKHLQEVVERGVGVYNAPGETLETVAA